MDLTDGAHVVELPLLPPGPGKLTVVFEGSDPFPVLVDEIDEITDYVDR